VAQRTELVESAPWRHRSCEYWQERAERIAPEVGTYARTCDSDDVLSTLRTVQSVVTHLEKFPRERAIAACTRAQHFGSLSYGAIKSILRHRAGKRRPRRAAAPASGSTGELAAAPPSRRAARPGERRRRMHFSCRDSFVLSVGCAVRK